MNVTFEIKIFLKRLLVLSIVLLAVSVAINFLGNVLFVSKTTPFLILFFFIITAIVHMLLVKLTDQRPGKFISGFMLTTTLKLFLYVIILIAYAFSNRTNAVPFIITFFCLYLLYTIFEVVHILPILKQNNQSK